MKKTALLLAVFSLATAAFAGEANFKIDGMVCESGCVKAVNDALTKLPGITDKKVELGKATVKFDDAKVKQADIVAAITKAGYKVVN